MKGGRRAFLPCVLLAWFLTPAGCHLGGSSPGNVSIVSMGEEPAAVDHAFNHAWYMHDPLAETSFYLTDVPLETLLSGEVEQAHILHVSLLWRPKAGRTPMDPEATNLSIHYVVISGGQVGIYGGGGFGTSSGAAGEEDLLIRIRDSSLRLIDSTEGFVDRLPRCEVRGGFRADLDPQAVRRLRLAVSQLLTDALGRTRFVDAGPVATTRFP